MRKSIPEWVQLESDKNDNRYARHMDEGSCVCYDWGTVEPTLYYVVVEVSMVTTLTITCVELMVWYLPDGIED